MLQAQAAMPLLVGIIVQRHDTDVRYTASKTRLWQQLSSLLIISGGESFKAGLDTGGLAVRRRRVTQLQNTTCRLYVYY